MVSNLHNSDCDCCRNELNLDKLCAKKIKVHNLQVKYFCADELSSHKLCVDSAVARDAQFQVSAINTLNANNICNQNLTSTNAGIVNATVNNLCVSGPLQASNLLAYGKYRASATYSKLTTYVLGTLINFDTILDDPNSNLTTSPTTYTVPLSGYYSFSFNIVQQNLVVPGPILGVPASDLQLYVNGVLARESFSAFLSFFPQQRAVLSGLISLNAGDQVQLKYNVLVIDSVGGLVPLVGTIDNSGNGTEDNSSLFKIHLLSVNAPSIIPCAPVIPCSPSNPLTCVPCNPCESIDSCAT